MTYTYDDDLRQLLRDNIERFDDRRIDDKKLTHAAVALTGVDSRRGASFLLTRRTATLNAHSRQFAIPGGRLDPGENAIEAALRELHEEMGVELGKASVLGLLDDYPTRSGYRITAVVVWAGGAVKVTPQPSEVERVHVVTLERLARPETPEFALIPESDRPLIRLNIARAKVHAPTAAIIYQFREVCLFGHSTRVDHLEQPVFAWR